MYIYKSFGKKLKFLRTDYFLNGFNCSWVKELVFLE